MEKIFAIRKDGYKYQELDLNIDDFIENFPDDVSDMQAHTFSRYNMALKSFWKYMRTGFSPIQGEENLIPDVTTWIDATLLLSPKAYRLLGDTLQSYGEFLPILLESGEEWEEYQIFNCLTMVDVIEEKSSDTHTAFDPDSVGDKLIFKTDFQHCYDLFCQPRLKAIFEDFKLKGVIFDSHLGTFQS